MRKRPGGPGHAELGYAAASMTRERRGSFFGWVVVSYFAICGGLSMAAAALVFVPPREPLVPLAAFAAGAAIGGLFAGRASPHRSYVEPAVAAALVVASVLAYVKAMPMGALAITYVGDDDVWRAAAYVGGAGAVAGFVGALVGEASAGDDLHPGALRWLGMSVLLTAGALFAASIAAGGLLLNEAAEKAIADVWAGREVRDVFDEERVTVAVALALGAASFLGGLVTQMAAPRRLLLPSSGGALLLVGGAVLASAATLGQTRDSLVPALVTGALAAAIALAGAVLGWIVRKASRSI